MEEQIDNDVNINTNTNIYNNTNSNYYTGDTYYEHQNPKHLLIKTNIIDKGYDKHIFFEFLASRKTFGEELQNWEYDELKEVVDTFSKYQEEIRSLQKEKEIQILQEQNRMKEMQRTIENIKMSNNTNNTSQTKSYSQEIQCKKLEKTELNDIKVECIIKNHQITETGFFQSNYSTYEISTSPLNWSVRRRYSDFEWLRQCLVKFHPRLYVPPIPSKKLGSRRFESDFVEKRMNFLQKFLNSINESETFKASECMVCFLSLTDRIQFEYKMKELSSKIQSTYVEDVRTFSGKLQIVDDESNEKYYLNINNYFRLQYQLLERLNFNLKQYYYNTAAACNTLDNIQKDFETLHLLNSRVLMKEEITKTYEELGVFFKNWKRIQFNQNEIIKNRIKDFFKYIKMEGVAYEELVRSREELKNKYLSELKRLQIKKEKLWTMMDVKKWEIVDEFNNVDHILLMKDKVYAFSKMCGNETENVESLHKQLGYANRNNIEELKKMLNRNRFNFIKNIKDFTEEFYPSLNDSLNVWTEVASFADIK
jgi:hypothetical protein